MPMLLLALVLQKVVPRGVSAAFGGLFFQPTDKEERVGIEG